MNLYLLTFSFIQYPWLFITNITCDLSKVTKGILITNVTCNQNLQRLLENRCFSSNGTIFTINLTITRTFVVELHLKNNACNNVLLTCDATIVAFMPLIMLFTIGHTSFKRRHHNKHPMLSQGLFLTMAECGSFQWLSTWWKARSSCHGSGSKL